jgi:hypothetical protein
MKVHVQQRETVLLLRSIFSNTERKILSVRNKSILRSGCPLLCTSKAKRGTSKGTETKAGLQDNYNTCSSFVSNELIQVQVPTTNGGDNPSTIHNFSRKSHTNYLLNSLHIKKNPVISSMLLPLQFSHPSTHLSLNHRNYPLGLDFIPCSDFTFKMHYNYGICR